MVFYFHVEAQQFKDDKEHVLVMQFQVAEHAYFAELGHAGEESKLDISVHTLHNAVEGFESIAVFVLQFIVVDSLQQRFVIFVNQNDYTHACLLPGTFDNVRETFFRATVFFLVTIQQLPSFQMLVEYGRQIAGKVILFRIQRYNNTPIKECANRIIG